MADTDHRNRIVFLGAGRVGKTAILKRFLFNTFGPDYKETVEDLYARDYNIRGTLIKVDLLDTAGNLTFPAMRRLSITTAHAFVLVYSITSAESFTEVTRLWTQIQEERLNWKFRFSSTSSPSELFRSSDLLLALGYSPSSIDQDNPFIFYSGGLSTVAQGGEDLTRTQYALEWKRKQNPGSFVQRRMSQL
ncbi:hypothetical protein EGW08_013450 [Elysia chlorotica]|uniref:Small monomeric GTPase n=1 Tax=Elysia chlorotica TaxID=188477 RepID=A0A433TBA4_ELYCH|nr:hypothetical protein EGW08_013450 [Elysia chlorotica]